MKINNLEVTSTLLAYDRCHKIYLLESENDRNEAIDTGYEIIGIDQLEKVWNNSCGLRFICNWTTTTTYVAQDGKLVLS
ncbi:hypothetical protein ACQKNX_08070 [Lysinibacillus sp. NPDC093712]|uniref:hypothetical protein n=1 Tax=Lysinibacillus sp. NPDC093712 TaxID=3390579 RepID=UPI003D05D263